MKGTWLRFPATATALIVATFSLHATVLVPGDTNKLPDVFPSLGSPPPLLATLAGTFNINNGTLTGTWHDIVAVDPFGVTCTGCLDFAFNVSIDPQSTGGISSLNLASFFGFTTDVGYAMNAIGDHPITISRGSSGGEISFNLIFENTPLPPGAATVGLVVATNAKTFDTGGNVTIDGIAATGGTITGQINDLFEPTSIPEPSTALLLFLGLAGIATLRKRPT